MAQSAKRGHVGMVTCGQGAHREAPLVDRLISWPVGKEYKLEARRLRGSVDQKAVTSI